MWRKKIVYTSTSIVCAVLISASSAGTGREPAPQAPPAKPAKVPPPAQGLSAPQIGTAANPFSNTCDGRAIGFFGPSGEVPTMVFTGAPAGATFECRTGPAQSVAKQPFRACDGQAGKKPSHRLPLTTEGSYRTEVRYNVNKRSSAVAVATYYVHHSLDRVSCCSTRVSDVDLFAAARRAIPSAETFTNVRLDNPFIAISRPAGLGRVGTTRVLSLRRTFRLSGDRRLLLIRRTMASRRDRERTGKNSCVGLRISAPVRSSSGATPLSCSSDFPRQQRFEAGLVASRCPGLYCTVSTCAVDQNGCIRITHTFNRGPGQTPWVVTKNRCPAPVLTSFTSYECDAYVLNAKGQAACLAVVNGRPQVRQAFTDRGTGLRILSPQHATPRRGQPLAADRYVFSAKAKRAGVKNALFLPD